MNYPKCGCIMTLGAPHGPWAVQYECRQCGTIVPKTGNVTAPQELTRED